LVDFFLLLFSFFKLLFVAVVALLLRVRWMILFIANLSLNTVPSVQLAFGDGAIAKNRPRSARNQLGDAATDAVRSRRSPRSNS
jgi:hypothetical protein